jgi:hydrogenase maturation factor
MTMEKYGVDEGLPEELQKLAASGCPECGAKPLRRGNILLCPEHGSAPFERVREEDGQ